MAKRGRRAAGALAAVVLGAAVLVIAGGALWTRLLQMHARGALRTYEWGSEHAVAHAFRRGRVVAEAALYVAALPASVATVATWLARGRAPGTGASTATWMLAATALAAAVDVVVITIPPPGPITTCPTTTPRGASARRRTC
jgi:hypothetical protein